MTVDASGSVDPDSEIVLYQWFEDGELLAESNAPTVVLDLTPGVHDITLRVTAADGGRAEASFRVTVQEGEPPAGQPAPSRGNVGCGLFNGIAMICLPLSLVLWLGRRGLARRRVAKG